MLDIWGTGFQALGIAKVWSGKARLPSIERMWKEYPGAGNEFFYFPGLTQCKHPLRLGRPNDQTDNHWASFITSLGEALHNMAE